MTIATLVQKLRTKKQATARSAFSHYLEAVKALADGRELDADECSHILESADRDETALERDVGIQQQRNARAATLQANRQAVADQIVAQNAMADAQRKLQDAYDRLQPAVSAAHEKLADANHRHLVTMGADAWLAGNVLDHELLEREAAVIVKLRDASSELSPLLQDREHKRHSLQNAQYTLAKLTGRPDESWLAFGTINPFFWKNKETTPAQDHVADLQSQVQQLDEAIRPRLQQQRELQRELESIHAEKLKP